jgi:hypothetical protein
MRRWTIISKDQENKMHRYARQSMANDAPSAALTKNGSENATNTPTQAKPVRLGWGTPHHHVGINLPSHPTNGAPNPAAHEPTHISPLKGAAKPLVQYRWDASNTDDEYYNFAKEGGFYSNHNQATFIRTSKSTSDHTSNPPYKGNGRWYNNHV